MAWYYNYCASCAIAKTPTRGSSVYRATTGAQRGPCASQHAAPLSVLPDRIMGDSSIHGPPVGPLGQSARKTCGPARALLNFSTHKNPKPFCVLCIITWREAHKRARLAARSIRYVCPGAKSAPRGLDRPQRSSWQGWRRKEIRQPGVRPESEAGAVSWWVACPRL